MIYTAGSQPVDSPGRPRNPSRGSCARFNAGDLAASVRWLATSREHSNYKYDLTDLNRGKF